MANPFKDLFKHSFIYGIGQAVTKLGSFLLLPLYTSYLRPADYGVVAILDFTTHILSVLIGAGMAGAMTRFHFQAKTDDERSQVWWTGISFVVMAGVACLVPAMLARDSLAYWTLGPTIENGGYYYALVLPTMGVNVVAQMLDGYMRVRKWSGLSVGINLFRLFLNIGLNVYCLVVLDLGVAGILIGNLIASVVNGAIVLFIFVKHMGTFSFYFPLLQELWQFGTPLLATVLLTVLMHQSDRYLIRTFLDMDQVGLYSFAYKLSQGIYTAFVFPFMMIWNVVVYEIAKRDDAKKVYAQVFEYFTYTIGLIMLGMSLFSGKLLELMAGPEYMPAEALVPIVCLSFVFYALHDQFRVPVLLANKTVTMLPVVSAAAVISIVVNVALIPLLGAAGAAWTSVITCAAYSFIGLARYRRVDSYPYPFKKTSTVMIGMVLTYLLYNLIVQWQGNSPQALFFAIGSWLSWAIILVAMVLRKLSETEGWEGLRLPFRLKGVS